MMARTPAEKWLRGPVGFAAISALHLLVIYLIATTLGKVQAIAVPPAEAVLVEDRLVPADPPPPDLHPNLDGGTRVDPLPGPAPIDDPVDRPDDTAVIPIRSGDDPRGVSGPALTVTAPRIDARHPLSQPEYPAGAIRLGNEGRVLLRLSVGPDGRVLAAEVVTSSGFPALDQAAVRTALREWRLAPARQGDAAVAGTFSTWVRFDLTDR
jgi:protein TonB